MTLIVGIKAQDAIVLAADSRGTIGDPRGLTAINDNHVKIFPLGRCGVAFAGASEMGSVLLDELNKQDLPHEMPIDELVQTVSSKAAAMFGSWFGSDISPLQRPAVLMTLAGYRHLNNSGAEAMIYMLNSQMNFAPQLFNTPCLSGVPQYAVYLIHRYYDPSISGEKAKALAEYLISETASQDPKVGGRVKIAEITSSNGYRELPEDEVKQINLANQELNSRLRRFFLTSLEG